jgi:hypothetical protein
VKRPFAAQSKYFRADVGAALLGRVELREQPVRVAALAHEVVHLGSLGHGSVLGDARGGEAIRERRRERVEQALALDEARKAQPELGDHHRADVARRGAAARDAELRAQRVQIARVRGRIVEAVAREVRVAVAAQVGDDHVEAERRERTLRAQIRFVSGSVRAGVGSRYPARSRA